MKSEDPFAEKVYNGNSPDLSGEEIPFATFMNYAYSYIIIFIAIIIVFVKSQLTFFYLRVPA